MRIFRHDSGVTVVSASAVLAKVLAGLFCAYPINAAAIPTHDFALVAVNSAATFTLSATVSGVTAVPNWSSTGGSYSIGTASCTVSGGTASCTVPIQFAPLYPGLQFGALYAKNASGTLLATYFLQGTGTASELAFSPGTAGTLAGNHAFGYFDGSLANASFANPTGLAIDQNGNIYVADAVNQVVRKVTGTAVSTVAGNGTASASELNNPTGVAVDAANNLYIADQGNGLIRRLDATSGVITTVAGGGSTSVTTTGTSVPAVGAFLYGPQSVAVDALGNLYISASYLNMVYRVDAASGLLTLYAGNGAGAGTDGWGDGGLATSAILNNPTGLALDSGGNLYICDTGHSLVRMVSTAGVITAVAGNGRYGYTGDMGLATHATLQSPTGVRLDAAGNLYIADSGSNVIRQTLAAKGTIFTLAGTGTAGYAGDGGAASQATLANPSDLVLGATGILYIADTVNNVIRQVTPVPPALSFGSVAVGAATDAQAVTLVNRGNQSLVLSGESIPSGFKQVAGLDDCTSVSVLLPGGTCTANIAFAPPAALTFASNLSFNTNSLNTAGTQSVGLSGTGTNGSAPQAVLSATSLNFGNLPVFDTQSQTVTLTNSGAAALTIFGMSLTGNGSSVFNLSTTCGATLAPGASCASVVTFVPAGASGYSASLTFNDTAGTSPQVVTMMGAGRSGVPSGLVQQWDNQGVLYLLPYSYSASSFSGAKWLNTGQGYVSNPDGTPDLIAMDVNGDGKLDLVQQWNNQGILYLMPYIWNGATYAASGWVNTGQGYASNPDGTPDLIPMDMNGDGNMDLVQQWNNAGVLYLLPYLSNGTTFAGTNWLNTGQGYISNPDGTPDLIVMDFNGDGKMDLVQQWDNRGVLYLQPMASTGSAFTIPGWINTTQGYWSNPDGTPDLIVMDMNGDGKMDLVQQWDNLGVLYLEPFFSTGTTFTIPGWIDTTQGYISNPDGTPDLIVMDINGDGKMDLVQQWNNRGVLYLEPLVSTGSTFTIPGWIDTTQGYWSNPDGTPDLLAMDLNGDGKTDLVQQWNNNGVLYLQPYISNGATFSIPGWINTGQGYVSTPGGTPGLLVGGASRKVK